MIRILKEPFPLEKNFKKVNQRLILLSILVYFMLVVFKPFGLKDHSGLDLYVYSGGFVLLGHVYLLFHFFIIESYFKETKWNLGKEILNNLFILVIIGFVNALYYSVYEEDNLNLIIIVAFEIYTLLIGIVPVTLSVVIRQNRLMRYHNRLAENINFHRMEDRKEIFSESTVKLKSLNPEKEYIFNCQDLILMHAQDNYILLYLIVKGQLHNELIRNTMKQCLQDLNQFPMFFRCHRSFIVNLNKIVNVEGNAQGLKLKLESIEEKVPVSRNLIKEFNSKLKQFAT